MTTDARDAFAVVRTWDVAVAKAGHGGDEAGAAVVVVELDAQAPDVPIHDVAFRHEVRAPYGIQDLVPRDDLTATTGEDRAGSASVLTT